MKILIIGNIGSGKTTLGTKIQEVTGYKFIQIDELRDKYLKNTVSEEYYCLYKFLKAIEKKDNLILEFSGAGCHKYAVKRALELQDEETLIILCKTKLISTLRERIKNKEFNYGNPFNLNIKDHLLFIEKDLNNDISCKFWESINFKNLEFFMDDFKDLELNMQIIKKVLNRNSK